MTNAMSAFCRVGRYSMLCSLLVASSCTRQGDNADVYVYVRALRYVCDDGKQLDVVYRQLARQEPRIALLTEAGTTKGLRLTELPSGEYADAEWTWSAKEEPAFLTRNGARRLDNCHSISTK